MAFQSLCFRQTLPFTGPIYGGLKDGMTILVSGTVLKSCRRFQVDFQCGSCQMPRSDVAFHFNVRFDENCTVCNSHEKGGWQQEERKYDMVFRKGHPFEIRFLVNITSYVVLVDGRQYLEFKHRIPLSRVDTIGISGELEVVSISFQGPTTYPVCPHPIFPTVSQVWQIFHRHETCEGCLIKVNDYINEICGMQNKAEWAAGKCLGTVAKNLRTNAYPVGQCFQPQTYPLPYRATIYGGLFPSKSIIISGSVSPSAHRFHINLKAGNDVAFHLNPRFDENVIVRNSNLNMCWGSEERYLPVGMPLSCGQPFTIWIQCEAHCFKVAVNGHHQFEYNHRVHNLHQINLLEVEGDVMLTNIQA